MELLAKILTFPFRVLYYLLTHIKLLVLAFVACLAVFAFVQCQKPDSPAKTDNQLPVQSYQVSAPSKKTCPVVVQTSSRVYYVADYTEKSGVVTLTKYYSYDKAWTMSKVPLTLDPAIYGKVAVYERK